MADGAGTGIVSGSGDAEKLTLGGGQDWTFPSVQTGAVEIKIVYDKYQAGSGGPVTIEYRTGVNKEACEAADWDTYTGHFTSLNWVQMKMRNGGAG